MTNKEAIYIINNKLNTYYCTDEDLQALDLAIKALEVRNAELFKQTFGMYATEVWSMSEADFVKWLNQQEFEIVSPVINANITEETKQKLIEELQKPHTLLVLPESEVTFERPQGDLISRDALKKDIDFQHICECCHDNGNVCDICPVAEIEKKIDEASTVEQNWKFYYDHGYKQAERDLKRPQGEWEEDSGNIACSHCHTIWLYRRTEFCPNCGADMRKGGTE